MHFHLDHEQLPAQAAGWLYMCPLHVVLAHSATGGPCAGPSCHLLLPPPALKQL